MHNIVFICILSVNLIYFHFLFKVIYTNSSYIYIHTNIRAIKFVSAQESKLFGDEVNYSDGINGVRNNDAKHRKLCIILIL